MARPKLVNLARSYAYQSKGYYASLLAEARGHRVVPTVETMLELREAKLYEHALPELEDELNRCARRADFQPGGRVQAPGLLRHRPRLTRFESFGRLLFDWFRCPALEVIVEPGQWLPIERIRPRNINRLANGEGEFFRESLHQHTKREWRDPEGSHQSPNTTWRCCTIRMRRCRRPRRPRSSISPASPRSCRSTSSRSPGGSWPSWPNTTACSSARPPRSTTTPTASRAAPGRRACRSSTTRSR